MKETTSRGLTWDELADEYDKACSGGRPARTLPMDAVFNWAACQEDIFYVDPEHGTIHFKR